MGCCRVAAQISVEDTDCIDLIGDGSPMAPLQAEPILAPTVIGLGQAPEILGNGISCGPTGLEVQPDRVTYLAFGGGLPGSLPMITTDQAGAGPNGSAAWGARLEVQTIQQDPNRASIPYAIGTFPGLNIVLEPGAVCEVLLTVYGAPINAPVGALTPIVDTKQWQFENNGPTLQTFATPPFNDEGPAGFFPAGSLVGDFVWRGYQVWIRTTGFTGPSSVTAYLGGAGVNVFIWGWPF